MTAAWREWVGVTAAVLVGSLLALQGWRERVPSLDLIPHLDDAETFVRDGAIPEKGCLSSFGAYIPPGPTWLFAPGVAAKLPGRLVQYPATLFLFALTAAGMLLLGNLCFGRPAGVWCAVVYCVSDRGLFFASSLWPRGHPAFVVWTVYFLCLWASRRRAGWLGAAAATFAAGLYVFMEILPLALAVPFVWLRYRPPIRLASVLVAAATVAMIWWPYLWFEAGRDWRDLKAILTRTSLPLDDPRPLLCDPEATVVDAAGRELWPTPEREPARHVKQASPWEDRLRHVRIGLTENVSGQPGSWAAWLGLLAVGFAWRLRGGRDELPADSAQGVFWRALLVSWVLLLLIPEADAALAGRRFWWLWPLQVVGAVGVLIYLTGAQLRARIGASAALVLLAFCSGEGITRVKDWAAEGFGGSDAEPWQIARRIAAEFGGGAEPRGQGAAIGYSVELWAHAFKFRVLDPRYKVGWEWDWLMRHDFQIWNHLDCPEGVSRDAEFEVVEAGLQARFAPRMTNGERVFEGRRYQLHRRR